MHTKQGADQNKYAACVISIIIAGVLSGEGKIVKQLLILSCPCMLVLRGPVTVPLWNFGGASK